MVNRIKAMKGRIATGPALALAALLVAASVWYGSVSKWKAEARAFAERTAYYLLHNGRQIHSESVRCAPGDTLQLGLLSAKPMHFAVLYGNDSSPIRIHRISGGGDADKVGGKPQGEKLPDILLESGWRKKILYCLWSEDPIPPTTALAAAESTAVRMGKGTVGEGGDIAVQAFLILNSRP